MTNAKRTGKRKALFIGRFQPLHNGHMRVLTGILKENASVTIVIGGPAKPDERNPFSFAERERMIRLALADEGIRNFVIRRVSDVNDDGEWSAKIKQLGEFDVAYSRNPWVIRCLGKIGIPVRKHAFYERYKNCGRIIRQRIMKGKEWKGLVPPAVYDYVLKSKGAERQGAAREQ